MLTPTGKACIKKILLSNCLQELMELHQVTSCCCLLLLYAIKFALRGSYNKYYTSSLKCMAFYLPFVCVTVLVLFSISIL